MFNTFEAGSTITAPEKPKSKSENTLGIYGRYSQEQQALLDKVMNLEGMAEGISAAVEAYYRNNEEDVDEEVLNKAFEDFQSSEPTKDTARLLLRTLRK